ncbi:hypothetical protein RF11_01873 [Thelohanellus kitauei]|uniref:Uncharacterized protein n=1 Tax=Thelohanellus kitauei TaxID=669202 RepID=A0A0C2ICR6_THEKT|nr:hypothetical protein RF11_01873 [Thelohanellus kitauei]
MFIPLVLFIIILYEISQHDQQLSKLSNQGTCYKILGTSHNRFVLFKFRDMFFHHFPFMVMNIKILYLDQVNESVLMSEEIVYYLKYYAAKCSTTMEIGNGNMAHTKAEFEIDLSVSPNVRYFTKYRFFMTEIHTDIVLQMSDFFKFADMFLKFKTNSTNVVFKPPRGFDWSIISNPKVKIKKIQCLAMMFYNRKIIFHYMKTIKIYRNYSDAVLMYIKVYNNSGEKMDQMLHEIELTGYRFPCYSIDNKFVIHPYIYLDPALTNIMIEFVITDIFYQHREKESLIVNHLSVILGQKTEIGFKYIKFLYYHFRRFQMRNLHTDMTNIRFLPLFKYSVRINKCHAINKVNYF